MKSKVKTILFLHGFLENKTMWSFLEGKNNKHIKLIGYDLLGHGENKVNIKNISISDMADDLFEFIEKKEIKSKITLVGHSMGAYVALEFLKNYPEKVKALCLLNSTSLADSPIKQKQRLLAIQAIEKNFKLFVHIGFKNLFAPQNRINMKKEIDYAKKMALENSTEGAIAATLAMRSRSDNSRMLSQNIPKAFIYGLYDSLVNMDDLEYQKAIAYRTQFFPLDSGHMSFLEQPDCLKKILFRFFEENS